MKNKTNKTGVFDEVTSSISEAFNEFVKFFVKNISKGLENVIQQLIPRNNENKNKKTRLFKIKSKFKNEKNY